MILTRTPYRVSLVGGGSDLQEHFREHGGAVIGFALAHYCHIMVRELPPYFEYKTRVVWSKLEHVKDNQDIEHPAVNTILKCMEMDDEGLAIHHDGDLPARSGMGSSSSFVVGLMHALSALRGQERIDKQVLAQGAIHLEHNVMREAVGWQDQMFAAHGGFMKIKFDNKGAHTENIYMSPKRLKYFLDHLMLVFTSLTRHASEIEKTKIENAEANKLLFMESASMVPDMLNAIQDGAEPDTRHIGHLLDRYWHLKQSLTTGVTNTHLDNIYETAMLNGAWGGKLLGAGGGGFFLFVVPPDKRSMLKEALGNPIEIPVKIDYHGSRVMVFEPNGAR